MRRKQSDPIGWSRRNADVFGINLADQKKMLR